MVHADAPPATTGGYAIRCAPPALHSYSAGVPPQRAVNACRQRMRCSTSSHGKQQVRWVPLGAAMPREHVLPVQGLEDPRLLAGLQLRRLQHAVSGQQGVRAALQLCSRQVDHSTQVSCDTCTCGLTKSGRQQVLMDARAGHLHAPAQPAGR